MYAENGGRLRAEFSILLRQHRVQQRLGGAGSHTIKETTTVDERVLLGEQIGRYRHSALAWCLQAVRAANPHMHRDGPSTGRSGPARELRHRLEAAITHSSGPPSLDELTTEQAFAMVESWRHVARATTLGEHDFDAGLGHGSLTAAQCMTLLKDAADVAQALVALDRRYSNIPGWRHLKNAGWLARAAETCSTVAGQSEPDYTIDLRGWQPSLSLVEGPALPGLTGVLQAQHNLLVHLADFPEARSLRFVLDSQRIVSRDAANIDPDESAGWSRRASTYLKLIRATHDIGGIIGNGGAAAGEAALAASRMEDFARSATSGNTAVDPDQLRHLTRLGQQIDEQVAGTIQRGARERLYFTRVPLPRIERDAAGLVKPTRQRYTPITTNVCPELLDIVRSELLPRQAVRHAPTTAASSRQELAAALVHRPEPRRANADLSL
ncbi:hypothetical protein [Nocardioides ferulae]|uniref:hypothetical protein n=1 Tax=Nocardioides ferulae TaxID=2340821 RepID=UPI000EB0AAC5|nr:hypothetical protein [Nocardioides ferulae]